MIVGGRGFDDLDAMLGDGFDLDDESNLNSQVVRSMRTQVFADVSDNPQFASDFQGSAGIRGWICAPMIVGDRVVGVISVDKFEPDFYNDELAELATAFATQAAIAIETRTCSRPSAPPASRPRRCVQRPIRSGAPWAAPGLQSDPGGAAQGGALSGRERRQVMAMSW